MTSYIKTEDNFGEKEVRPIRSGDISKFKKNKFSQPLPGENKDEILKWAKSLCMESYNYKKELHNKWYNNAMDYYVTANLDSKKRAGVNNGVDTDQDTEVMVPALIKRYVELGAFWLVRQIFKSEPFMQFTSYSDDDDVRKAQKLYERKIQGDTETFGARDKSTQLGIDLFLYGNAVAKVQFHQERLVIKEIPELNLDSLLSEEPGYEPSDLDPNEVIEEPGITEGLDSPYPSFAIIDQYAEFKPVYLGHHILDPVPSNRDWRKARYMGDIEIISMEEIYERYGSIPSVKRQLDLLENGSSAGIENMILPFGDSGDKFLNSWLQYTNNDVKFNTQERQLHNVLHLYTKYTETVIIDNKVIVYHRYRSKNVSKAGAYPYVMFTMPKPAGGLYSVGYGHVLRTLQKEQIILASKRNQTIEEMNGTLITYVGGSVDEDKVKQIGSLKLLELDQQGAVQELVPNHQSIDMLLNAETRNFERSRDYCGIPAMLDGSDTKTHLGNVQGRMEASQVQFDVILDNVRDGYKELFSKMHILNMAYLEGEVPIKGSTGPFDKDFDDNVLSETELLALATQPDLAIGLNLGVDVGTDKLKSFSALLNVALVNETIKQLQASGQIAPEKLKQMLGMLFDLSGLSEFRSIFTEDALTPPPMEGGAPGGAGQAGMPPQELPPQGIPPQGMPQEGGAAQAMPPQGPPGQPPMM